MNEYSPTNKRNDAINWIHDIILTAHGPGGSIVCYKEYPHRAPQPIGYFFESVYWKGIDVYGFFSVSDIMDSLPMVLQQGWIVDTLDLATILALANDAIQQAQIEDAFYGMMRMYPEQFRVG